MCSNNAAVCVLDVTFCHCDIETFSQFPANVLVQSLRQGTYGHSLDNQPSTVANRTGNMTMRSWPRATMQETLRVSLEKVTQKGREST